MKRIFPLFILAMTLITACGSDDELENTTDKTTLSEEISDFMCKTVETTVTADEFLKYAVGYGWKNIAEYRVDNKTGKAEDKDMWGRDADNPSEGLDGASPTNLSFLKDAINSYFFFDAGPFCAYTSKAYQYDVNKGIIFYNELTKSNTLSMRVVSIDERRMVALCFAAVTGSYIPVYTYVTYERMTKEEFEEMVRVYNHKM